MMKQYKQPQPHEYHQITFDVPVHLTFRRTCQNCLDMASKQQELDVLDSWEDIDESDVLERKFGKLIPPGRICSARTPDGGRSLNGTNGSIQQPQPAQFNIILTGDDALRTQFAPPEPTVTILRRPNKDSANSNDGKVFQPKKTLKQREQEYAEARLRILGEPHTPDKPEERVSSIQNKPRSIEIDNVIRLPKGPDGTRGFTERR